MKTDEQHKNDDETNFIHLLYMTGLTSILARKIEFFFQNCKSIEIFDENR